MADTLAGRVRTVTWLAGAAVAAAALGPAAPAWAEDEALVLARLRERQATLAHQTASAESAARQQAWLAYRLARRRQLGFLADETRRLEDAQAVNLALDVLVRGVAEARAHAEERDKLGQELLALTTLVQDRQTTAQDDGPAPPVPRFRRPVTGAIVGEPGLRRDPGNGTELRQHALRLLARLNEPVRAPAAGVVRRVEALPQGGYAVVVEHPGGWVSILSGMRQPQVEAGAPVDDGQALGLAGRNLDGAAVLSVELWHRRRPVDPRALLVRR